MQRHFYTFVCAENEDVQRVQYNGFLEVENEPKYANAPNGVKFIVKGYDDKLNEAEKKIILRELCASYYVGLKFFGKAEQAYKVRKMYLDALEESYDDYTQVVKIGAIGKIWGKRVINMEYERTKWIIREFQMHEEFTDDKAIPIEELSQAYDNLQDYLIRNNFKYTYTKDGGDKEVENGVSNTKGNGNGVVKNPRGRRPRSMDGATQG